jgi:hypothetical protein
MYTKSSTVIPLSGEADSLLQLIWIAIDQEKGEQGPWPRQSTRGKSKPPRERHAQSRKRGKLGAVNQREAFGAPLEKSPDPGSRFSATALIGIVRAEYAGNFSQA